jgi:hypothetical protein
VVLDRALGEEQPLGDLGVGHVLRDQVEDLPLATRQPRRMFLGRGPDGTTRAPICFNRRRVRVTDAVSQTFVRSPPRSRAMSCRGLNGRG